MRREGGVTLIGPFMYKLKDLKLCFTGNVEPLEGAASDYKSAKIRVIVKNHSGSM